MSGGRLTFRRSTNAAGNFGLGFMSTHWPLPKPKGKVVVVVYLFVWSLIAEYTL